MFARALLNLSKGKQFGGPTIRRLCCSPHNNNITPKICPTSSNKYLPCTRASLNHQQTGLEEFSKPVQVIITVAVGTAAFLFYVPLIVFGCVASPIVGLFILGPCDSLGFAFFFAGAVSWGILFATAVFAEL